VLLGSGHCGFGGVDLRLRGEVFRLSVVEFLLGDEAGMPLGGFAETFISGMKSSMGGFRAADLVLRASDLFLALRNLENGLLELRFEFRDFENREGLTLSHNVSDVDIDLPHVTANFGVDVDCLIRLELPGKGQHVTNFAPLRGGDTGGGDGCGLGYGSATATMAR
jgi:hypothetical protein